MLTIWYLMDRYQLSEEEATKYYREGQADPDADNETED